MSVEVLHGAKASALEERFARSGAFLTITTYRMAMGIGALQERVWDCVILDEAQAIKDLATKQTRPRAGNSLCWGSWPRPSMKSGSGF